MLFHPWVPVLFEKEVVPKISTTAAEVSTLTVQKELSRLSISTPEAGTGNGDAATSSTSVPHSPVHVKDLVKQAEMRAQEGPARWKARDDSQLSFSARTLPDPESLSGRRIPPKVQKQTSLSDLEFSDGEDVRSSRLHPLAHSAD